MLNGKIGQGLGLIAEGLKENGIPDGRVNGLVAIVTVGKEDHTLLADYGGASLDEMKAIQNGLAGLGVQLNGGASGG